MSLKKPFSQPVKKQTLAEQVAESVKESILSGDLEPGEALPTEPELAEAFGVSRAVIRDATRMLAAQGLVAAQHGRGVFVTESQVEAFGDALLLALRRGEATVWDVEAFEQMIYPEVAAMAATEATDEELAEMRVLLNDYIEKLQIAWHPAANEADISLLAEREAVRQAFVRFIASMFAITHNAVLSLLAMPLMNLHSMRDWDDEEDESVSFDESIEMERAYLTQMIDAVASRDPDYARTTIRRLMKLPVEAETAMRETAVGDTPIIPLSLSRWVSENPQD